MVLTFDRDTHTYQMDGAPVPSVSVVLTQAGLKPSYGSEADLQRGRDVHRLCQAHDEDAVDMPTVNPDLLGYLLAWQAFREATGFVPTQIEQMVGSTFYRVAGTPDRVGTAGGQTWLVDIKSGQPTPADVLQTAAYQYLLGADRSGCKIDTRLAVYLRPDGTYTTRRHPDAADIKIFLAALAVTQWRQAHGLIQNGGLP